MRVNNKAESRLSASISRYMILKGFLVIRVNSSAGYHGDRYVASYIIDNVTDRKKKSRGFPDRLCLKDDGAILIEVKIDDGDLSDGQKDFRELAAEHGVRVLVARCLDDVINFVERGVRPPEEKRRRPPTLSVLDAEIARIRREASR